MYICMYTDIYICIYTYICIGIDIDTGRYTMQLHGAVLSVSRSYAVSVEAQKATETKGSDILVQRPNLGGIPQIMVCGILMFP